MSCKQSQNVLIICTLLAIISSTLATADPPSGHEIIQRFIDVSGGFEAYSKIQNRVIMTKLDSPDHGMEGETVEILARSSYRQMIVIDIYDPVIIGQTDGVPWRANDAAEPETLEGAPAADIKRHAQLNPFLDWTPKSGTANLLGDATLDEDECFRVEITPAAGTAFIAFFSKKTGLLRRTDDWPALMFRSFDDYRDLDGVLVPYALEVETGMMMTYFLTITSVKQNTDLEKFTTGQHFTYRSAEEAADLLRLKSK